jgi:hypothetical protein
MTVVTPGYRWGGGPSLNLTPQTQFDKQFQMDPSTAKKDLKATLHNRLRLLQDRRSTRARVRGQRDKIAADIARRNATIAANKAEIAANNAEIAANKLVIDAHKAEIDTHKAELAACDAKIAANQEAMVDARNRSKDSMEQGLVDDFEELKTTETQYAKHVREYYRLMGLRASDFSRTDVLFWLYFQLCWRKKQVIARLRECYGCLHDHWERVPVMRCCKGCHRVNYCSVRCQRRDWFLQHKVLCKQLCDVTNKRRDPKSDNLNYPNWVYNGFSYEALVELSLLKPMAFRSANKRFHHMPLPRTLRYDRRLGKGKCVALSDSDSDSDSDSMQEAEE